MVLKLYFSFVYKTKRITLFKFRKLLDGHHIRILRYGEGILLLGLHQVDVGLVGVLTLSFLPG